MKSYNYDYMPLSYSGLMVGFEGGLVIPAETNHCFSDPVAK